MARPDLQKKYEEKRARLGLTEKWGREGERDVRLTQAHAVYAAMVEAMDLAVGKVLAQLDALGLRENTLVIFTSDNGGLSTSEGWPTSNLPLRGGKGWMYEGGIREPLLVRWPGTVKPGSVIGAPVSSPDFFPTLLEAAGAKPAPDRFSTGSVWCRCSAGRRARPCDFLAVSALRQSGRGARCRRPPRPLKLIHWFEDDRFELFNVVTDLAEATDLAAREPARVAGLRAELAAWQRTVGAVFPDANPAYDVTKPSGRAAIRPGSPAANTQPAKQKK